jgi:hypothetical protein
MKGNTDVSWIEIELEYVTDISRKPVTLDGLAEKHDIPAQSLRRYAADNKWMDKRKAYSTKVLQKTAEKTAEKVSEDIAEVLNKHLDLSNTLQGLIEDALGDDREFYKYVEKLKQPDFSEVIACEEKPALNTARLKQAVDMVEKLQKMQRQTLGILDAKDEIQTNLAIYKAKPKDDEEDDETESDGYEDAMGSTSPSDVFGEE